MNHSITFKNDIEAIGPVSVGSQGVNHQGYIIKDSGESRNAFEDWGLVAKQRPYFVPPKQKTNFLEVPGASYTLDLSESLTGYPVYDDREGSIEFTMLNDIDKYGEWYSRYSEIMGFLHGHVMRAFLDDDKEYFYEGRFTVDDYSPGDAQGNPWGKIKIGYKLSPYKWYYLSSIEPWLWDPFNFRTGMILQALFQNLILTTSWQSKNYSDFIGAAPFCPNLIVKTSGGKGATLRLVNKSLNFDRTRTVPEGTTILPDFIFYGNDLTFYYKAVSGSGTISVEFYHGRL